VIRGIAAALGGVTCGLAAVLVVLFIPSMTSSPNIVSTGLNRSQPITGPAYAAANLRFPSGASGIYSGILPGLLLLLLALGAGIVVAYMGVERLMREGLS
jgi:hypothetical protein